MGQRPKFCEKYQVPYSVFVVVRSICADYKRRRDAIERRRDAAEVLIEYERLNGIVDIALSEIECGIRQTILEDVSLGRGYDFSPASPFLAKNTYYSRKHKLVYDIARGMRLI